jgi:tetratricopeptide (TPR) repeat protein
MADPLSIKLRCASWQQLATIYKRDLSYGTMFLKAATPPPVGTTVHIDLALPSATIIPLTGVVERHLQDPQRGQGVELKLDPIAAGSIWLIESALASEHRRLATPFQGVPITPAPPPVAHVPGPHQVHTTIPTIPPPFGSSASILPGLQDGADLTAAERDLIKALVAEAESLKKLNPFLVLGVGYEATDAEVRAAFADLTKRYHPDRFARYESSALREVAAEIFILIRDAYRKLGDAASRVQVLQSLGKAAPAPRAIAAPRPATAVPPPRGAVRAVPQTGPVSGHAPTAPITIPPPNGPPPSAPSAAASGSAPLPRRGESVVIPPAPPAPPPAAPQAPPTPPPNTGPVRQFRRPTTNQPVQPPPPGEPVDVSALEDLIDQGRLDEALAGYRVLGKKFPHDRGARAGVELCEGLLALNVRDRLEAAQRFEAALEIDPSNERAARELADMRRQATNERKGLLSRLMGKKEP